MPLPCSAPEGASLEVTLFLDESGNQPNGKQHPLGLRTVGGPLCEGRPERLAGVMRERVDAVFAGWPVPRSAKEYANKTILNLHWQRHGFPERAWARFWKQRQMFTPGLPNWDVASPDLRRKAVLRYLTSVFPSGMGEVMARDPVRGLVLCLEHDRETEASRWLPMALSAMRRALASVLLEPPSTEVTFHVRAEQGHCETPALRAIAQQCVHDLSAAFERLGVSLRLGSVQIDPGKQTGHQGLVLADALTYFLGPRSHGREAVRPDEAGVKYHRKEFMGRLRRELGVEAVPLWLCGAYGLGDSLVSLAQGARTLPLQPEQGELIAALHDLQSFRDRLGFEVQGDA